MPNVHISHGSVARLSAPETSVVHQDQVPAFLLTVEPRVVGDLHSGLSIDDDFEPTEGLQLTRPALIFYSIEEGGGV